MSQVLSEEFLIREQKENSRSITWIVIRLPFFFFKWWGKVSNSTAGSQSQCPPTVGHEAALVGSNAVFFKAIGAWRDDSWAFATAHLPFSCQQPWPHSHFGYSTMNESVTSVEKQERGVVNMRGNCRSVPHLPWKWQSSKKLSLSEVNNSPASIQLYIL